VCARRRSQLGPPEPAWCCCDAAGAPTTLCNGAGVANGARAVEREGDSVVRRAAMAAGASRVPRRKACVSAKSGASTRRWRGTPTAVSRESSAGPMPALPPGTCSHVQHASPCQGTPRRTQGTLWHGMVTSGSSQSSAPPGLPDTVDGLTWGGCIAAFNPASCRSKGNSTASIKASAACAPRSHFHSRCVQWMNHL